MDSDQFNQWLEITVQSFSNLSDEQKSSALESLIQACGPNQLRYLSELQQLMQRDFLKWLPLELSYQVIKWLDVDSLRNCCLVSKNWKEVVDGCAEVWFDGCHRLGLNRKYEISGGDAKYWKGMCHSLSKKMGYLKDDSGKVFSFEMLQGHTSRITAIYYANGYIVSGSDDLSVRIWNVDNGTCEKVIQTHSCSDIKFDGTMLATASYNCSVGLWDMTTGSNIRAYVGHTSAVLCVDLCISDQIVVSGSGDMTVKVWSLESDQCLRTFHGHRSWVKKVTLRRSSIDSVAHRQGDLVLLSMDDYNIKIWAISSESSKCLGTLSRPALLNPINKNLPYLQLSASRVVCACYSGIHVWNFENLQYERFIDFNDQDIRCLLGYGSTFNLSLSSNSVTIRNYVGHIKLEKSICFNVHFGGRPSTSTCGDGTWLDGWGLVPETGLVFAAAVPHNCILMAKWICSF